MALFAELRRRNVIRVGAAYLVAAWLIVQVVATIAPAFDVGPWVVRVTVIALAIGFAPALILAWIFEITPQGLRRDSEAAADPDFARRTARNFDRGIIALLTLAAGYFAVDKFLLEPARDAALREQAVEEGRQEALQASVAGTSVAVLPFRNLSQSANSDFLSAGLAEDVLSRLALVPRLRVVSGYSSFAIQREDATLGEIAERLNAKLLVDGSVRQVGEQLRISLRLIDTRTDSQVWAQDYDRRLENVLALQSEIASSVVAALRAEIGLDIGDAPDVATSTPAAHEAYLRGRLLVRQRTPNAIRRAVEEFELAARLDPGYALAHAELAIALELDSAYSEQDAALKDRIRFHAGKAYEIDPNLAEANAAQAWVAEDEDTLRYLRRAVELNPNYSDAWYWIYVFGSSDLGLEERFDALEQSIRIDPLSQPANWDYVLALIARNRIKEATAQVDKYASLDSRGAILLRGLLESLGGNTAQWFLGYLEAASGGPEELIFGTLISWQWKWQFEQLGMVDEMLARNEGAMHDDPEFDVYFGDMARGIEEARATARAHPESWFAAMKLGQFLAHAGRLDEARPLLERGWQQLGASYLQGSHDLNSAILAESLIAARTAVGDDKGAQDLLAIWQEGIRKHRAAGITNSYLGFYGVDYHEGVARWLAGDRAGALRHFEQAVEDGFNIPPPSAFQKDRHADPAFAKLLERQDEIRRRERHEVLAIVCNGNPYADVWQPMETTCENYRRELAGATQ